jgi:adenylate cyclase
MSDNVEILNLLDAYDRAGDDDRPRIETGIKSRFAVDRAVLILDMSGFSLATRRHGIVFYLSLIRRMNRVAHPIIEKHGGKVIKFEADNVFAIFEDAGPAVEAAVAINSALDMLNIFTEDKRDIFVKIGIDFGEVLVLEAPDPMRSPDLFGEAVNFACKLGEDLAQRGEILVSARAHGRLDAGVHADAEPVEYKISGVKLQARRLRH